MRGTLRMMTVVRHPLAVMRGLGIIVAESEQATARGFEVLQVKCSCPPRLSQRFHVRTNDIANPADFGVTVDFIDVSLLLAKTIL